jgi:hypothetical protein
MLVPAITSVTVQKADIYSKGKGLPQPAFKAHTGIRSMPPLITNLSAIWGLFGQSHVPAALASGKCRQHPFYRRLGQPQRRSEGWVEEKMLSPQESEPSS